MPVPFVDFSLGNFTHILKMLIFNRFPLVRKGLFHVKVILGEVK